jgi:hypothetical protein
VAAFAGAALCFGLRVTAVRRGWHLPVAAQREEVVAEPFVAGEDEREK